MFERVVVVAALMVLVVAAVIAARRWNTRRLRRLVADDAAPLWDALGETPDGRRTVIAFSSPSCAACHAAQGPAVMKVQDRLGTDELRVIKVDAASQPQIARAFGILTVPSTVVLASAGQVVAVNQGFAPTGKLVEQLQRN